MHALVRAHIYNTNTRIHTNTKIKSEYNIHSWDSQIWFIYFLFCFLRISLQLRLTWNSYIRGWLWICSNSPASASHVHGHQTWLEMQYLRPKVWASSSCGHRWRLRSGDPEALLCWCVTGAAAGAAGLPELWGEPKKPSLWMSRQGCRHTPSLLNPIFTEPRPGSPALGPLPSSHGFCLGLSNLRLSGLKSPWQRYFCCWVFN